MTITTSNFAKALWPGINAMYGTAYKEWAVEWDKLFSTHKSNKAFEEDVGNSGLGLAQIKAQGAAISFDTAAQGFTSRYNHVTYGLGFTITREMVEDDQYDVVAALRTKALAFSLRRTKEILAANVYNRAFSNSYLGGDGASLVASAATTITSHLTSSGGSFTNGPATAVDLSEAALEQAHIDLGAITDDRGHLIKVLPKTLILPRQLVFEAKRILGSDARVGTANNDLNALKALGVIPEVVVNHYLTDADAWFIRTDVENGMKCFERRADAFEMDTDFDTQNARYIATFRSSFGWTDPRGLYGSPGA